MAAQRPCRQRWNYSWFEFKFFEKLIDSRFKQKNVLKILQASEHELWITCILIMSMKVFVARFLSKISPNRFSWQIDKEGGSSFSTFFSLLKEAIRLSRDWVWRALIGRAKTKGTNPGEAHLRLITKKHSPTPPHQLHRIFTIKNNLMYNLLWWIAFIR